MGMVAGPDTKLHEIIQQLHDDLKKWQESNTFVAWVMIVLTIAMLGLVSFQVYLQFFRV